MHADTPYIELLAPAGGQAALHAAVSAGADAVYLGLESFNARRSAENFTLETLEEACDYAHLRGVRVYVALNTVVLGDEMEEALELARQAYRAGADAFIVQDIGLASELSRTLPQARLHISTQMNTHTAAGIQAAARLGAARVTLARELSLEGIAHLADEAAQHNIEVETFAHGALCVCYSGQCLMSSMIGGRSANRGTCAQACRLPYELRNKALKKPLPSPGDHLLSPRDLCAIDLLPDLLDAGVASLKIEGRMKSPDYVHAVTAVYRAVLDRVLAARAAGGENWREAADSAQLQATAEERRALSEAFSRGFTTAYLENERGNDIMSYGRPNNRGVFIGRIGRATDDAAYLDAEQEISVGDVLEIWTGKGRATHTVTSLNAARDGMLRLPLDRTRRSERAVRPGDRVFRVRNAAAAFNDDALEPRIPVEGSVRLHIGEPLHASFSVVSGAFAPARGVQGSASAEGNVVEAARTKAVTEEEVREHIDRLGGTPFVLKNLEVELDAGVGIGFSQLHKVRAAALDALADKLTRDAHGRALPRVREREWNRPQLVGGCVVVALATNPVCARAAKRAGAAEVYVPSLMLKHGEALIAGQKSSTAEQASYPEKCVPVVSAVGMDPLPGTREQALGLDPWAAVKPDRPVLADSLGAIERAVTMGALVEAGPHVPLANPQALDALADLGVRRAWLSPELTLEQIRALGGEGAPVSLGFTVIGSQELMVTEHCLLMSQGPCDQDCAQCPRRKSPHYLRDRKGYEFPVITDPLGRSHLYNSVPTDVAHAVPGLLASGITALMVDTTLMNGEEAGEAVSRAVRARDLALRDGNAVGKIGKTTSGHLFRGIS